MNCFPFTSAVTFDDEGLPIYDRAADSSLLRRVFARYFSDGVFYNPSTSLNVTSDGGLAIKVDSGACHIQGATLDEKNITNIVLSQGGSQDRIDTVVARLDLTLTVNDIHIDLLQGTEASAPSAPTLTRNATVWELGLANIYVKANSQSVSSLNITDTRLDTTRCGVVAQTVKPIDTEPYFLQLQTAIDYLKTLIETTISGAAPNGFFYYLHTYSEQTKIHNFIATDDGTGATGAGTNGKALITAGFTKGDTFAVNGVAVDAYTGRYSTAELLNGRYMTFVFDGTAINFESNITPLTQKVLWANASITSSFAAQTIALDLSEYTHLIIEFRGSTFFSTISTVLIRRGSNSIEFSSDKNGYRSVTFSATGVVFSAANVFPVYGDTQIAVNNNYGIPAVIYGVKGVL